MARRIIAMLGLGLVLALLLPPPASDAQSFRFWNRRVLPGIGIVVPPPSRRKLRRGAPQVPNYFFDRRSGLYAPRRPFGPGDLISAMRARGFRDIGQVEQRGATFITEATGPAGERVRLVIDGRTGGIVGVRVIARPGRR